MCIRFNPYDGDSSAGLGIRSFAPSLFAILLKIAYFKEQDRERFAHVALYKRANMRD